jgi:plastocyanin
MNHFGVNCVANDMNRYSVAAAAAALALLLASCSSSKSGSPASTGPAGGNTTSAASGAAPAAGGITIKNFAFSGAMTVKPGEKVTVTNRDTAAHTLTDMKSGKFDTGNIDPGATGTFTAPSAAGSYPFGCKYHSNMHGTLVVKG